MGAHLFWRSNRLKYILTTFLGKQSIVLLLTVFLDKLWCFSYVGGQRKSVSDFKNNNTIIKYLDCGYMVTRLLDDVSACSTYSVQIYSGTARRTVALVLLNYLYQSVKPKNKYFCYKHFTTLLIVFLSGCYFKIDGHIIK